MTFEYEVVDTLRRSFKILLRGTIGNSANLTTTESKAWAMALEEVAAEVRIVAKLI